MAKRETLDNGKFSVTIHGLPELAAKLAKFNAEFPKIVAKAVRESRLRNANKAFTEMARVQARIIRDGIANLPYDVQVGRTEDRNGWAIIVPSTITVPELANLMTAFCCRADLDGADVILTPMLKDQRQPTALEIAKLYERGIERTLDKLHIRCVEGLRP